MAPETRNVLLAKPRTKNEWVKLWNVPSEEVLINGDEIFPDIHQRQRHLVGVAVDATIILHVYEKLKAGVNIEDIPARFFPTAVTKEDSAILMPPGFKTASPEEQERMNDARIERLLLMSREKRLLNRRGLVGQEAWDTSQKEAAEYDDALLRNNSSPAMRLDRKDDPRVVELKGMTEYTVIKDPGPKTLHSIQGKMKAHAKEISELTDLNRLAIMPQFPEYRNDFNRIMKLKYPPKRVVMQAEDFNKVRQSFPGAPEAIGPVEVDIPQVYIQPPKVFSHGYFSQMTFVAIDRTKGSSRNDLPTTKNNGATIGEIKFAPKMTEDAEEKTGIIKGVAKDLAEPTLYTSGGMVKRRDVLTKCYKEARDAYQKRFPEESRVLPFPRPILAINADHSGRYESLRNNLLRFRQDLPEHVAQSEEVTGPIANLVDLLKDPYLYVPDGTVRRRDMVAEQYEQAKQKYDDHPSSAAVIHHPDLQMPLFIPEEEGNNARAYEKLREGITKLQHHLNISALTAENAEWRKEFIETAVTQQVYFNGAVKDRRAVSAEAQPQPSESEGTQPKSDIRKDVISEDILKQVARGSGVRDYKNKLTYPNALDYDQIKADTIERLNSARGNLLQK